MENRNRTGAAFLESVTIPQQTASYKPVEHKRLIDLTRESAQAAGFSIDKENYTTSRHGRIATAYYDLKSTEDKDMGIRIAWQNSYDKSITLKFAIGSQVFVCSNGAFSGSLGAFKRRHTGNVQVFTPNQITEYFKTAEHIYGRMIDHKEQLKGFEIDRRTISELVGNLYINEGIIKETQIAIIKKEIIHPSFDYGAPGSAWEAYNHITHSLKTVPASDYIDAHQAVHQFFTDKYQLKNKYDQLPLELILS